MFAAGAAWQIEGDADALLVPIDSHVNLAFSQASNFFSITLWFILLICAVLPLCFLHNIIGL